MLVQRCRPQEQYGWLADGTVSNAACSTVEYVIASNAGNTLIYTLLPFYIPQHKDSTREIYNLYKSI